MQAWKELKTDTNMPEQALKSALCRITHHQKGEVLDLRPHEQNIANWLSERTLDAQTLYREANRKKSEYARRYTILRWDDKMRTATEIKAHLNIVVPDKTPFELRKMVRRISRFEYGEIKDLTPEELEVKDVLLKYRIRPSTVYQWLLQTLIPEELMDKVESRQISAIQAERAMRNRERQRRATLGLSILEQGRSMIKEVL